MDEKKVIKDWWILLYRDMFIKFLYDREFIIIIYIVIYLMIIMFWICLKVKILKINIL